MKRRFRVTEESNPEDIKAMIEQVSGTRVLSISISGGYADVEMEDPIYDDVLFVAEPWDDECKMCGRERLLNDEGYCSSCWQVWNS